MPYNNYLQVSKYNDFWYTLLLIFDTTNIYKIISIFSFYFRPARAITFPPERMETRKKEFKH